MRKILLKSHVYMAVVGYTAAVFLLACGGAPTAPTPTIAALPTAPLPDLPDDVLVIYHKTGGIAGVNETLTVGQGGVLGLVTRGGNPKSLKVNEPVIQPIRRMLEQKDFGELAPLYQAVGADLFTYTITARDTNGVVRSVTTMDGAKEPAYLGLLIGQLEQLRAIVAKNG